MVSLVIHAVLLLIASTFHITRTERLKDVVSVEILPPTKPPRPIVRGGGMAKYIAKYMVVKPTISADRSFVMGQVQVDFNSEVVSRFRLLGYENRRLAHEQFRDDTVDAGEVGSGHQVTALYEVKLNPDAIGKLATVSIRYADPDNHRVSEVSEGISVSQLHESFDAAPATFRLAAAVAEFAEILHESYWAKDGSLDLVRQVVKDAFPEADSEQVVELMYLVNKAISYKVEGS